MASVPSRTQAVGEGGPPGRRRRARRRSRRAPPTGRRTPPGRAARTPRRRGRAGCRGPLAAAPATPGSSRAHRRSSSRSPRASARRRGRTTRRSRARAPHGWPARSATSSARVPVRTPFAGASCVEGVGQRAVGELVVVAERLAVGRDDDRCAVGGGVDHTRDEVLARQPGEREGEVVGKRPVVEHDDDRPTRLVRPEVGHSRGDRGGLDVVPGVVTGTERTHRRRLAGRQDRGPAPLPRRGLAARRR